VGDGDAYQHTEQREDGHCADRSLDTARLYIPRELDRTLTVLPGAQDEQDGGVDGDDVWV